MIEEELEDCCDNCEEGIEPCCDELVAEEIAEVIETKGVTTDLDELAKHLCCQNKFYIIYKHMDGLNKTQLKKLRDQLRSYVRGGQLHPQLEQRFNRAIG